ncbi:MAG: hypothetical protein H7Y04_14385 [Verrucomicrobia bacterium]|nr:hypothetical protein [Cytophagales bacterium]
MKKLPFLFLAIFFAVLSSCSENKSNANTDDLAAKTNTEATQDGQA